MINDRIRFPQVRVVDEQNAQLGVMATKDAIDTARDRGLDLILVAPQAQPPVCRIMDYGKFKYEKSKREKLAHKRTAAMEMKMVRLHPRTGEHDRDILIRHCERFLREGHKVRVVCQFKGRENAYPQLGRAQMDVISAALDEIATVEGPIAKQGRDMTMNLAPRPGVKPLPKAPKVLDATGARKGDEPDEEQDEDAEFEALQENIMAEHDAEPDDADADVAALDEPAAE
jgi:translation initiation factor IF-3